MKLASLTTRFGSVRFVTHYYLAPRMFLALEEQTLLYKAIVRPSDHCTRCFGVELALDAYDHRTRGAR